MSNFNLKEECKELTERIEYFQWKLSTPPWRHNDGAVIRYKKLIAECEKELESKQSLLNLTEV